MRSPDGAGPGDPRPPPSAAELFHHIVELLSTMEEAQRAKVIALARRLLPTLTAEDIRNPHDFPELDDPDWHFEDGQLAGIEAVRFALRGLARDVLGDDEGREARERIESGGRREGRGAQGE